MIPPIIRVIVAIRILLTGVVMLAAASASAQPAQPDQSETEPPDAPAIQISSTQWQLEQISRNHLRMTGQVELEPPGSTTKFFADEVDLFTDTSELVATGNVVFASDDGRIAADRVEFNWITGTGTFHQARGSITLGGTVDRTAFGDQDPDIYFYGDMIEKVGSRRYRITRGGFTTCVQPTPRWEVTSSTIALSLDDYAIARNTILRVKGVPLLYLPVVYYPIQDDNRATGILMPTYGSSTLRGQAISNALFWAINRSQDATFVHDWFTRTGQGIGAEYRFVTGPQSSGDVRFYRFGQQQTSFEQSGTVNVLPESTSYELNGAVTQAFGRAARARVRLDYFSDVVSQQLYHQNVYQASRRNRVVEGSLSAAIGRVTTSALYQRNETFNSATNSVLYGSTPRLAASMAPLSLFGSPVYVSTTGEFSYLPYRYFDDGQTTRDDSLGRIDFSPTIRAPLSRLTFLSINASATYQTTHYTRSIDEDGETVSRPYTRQLAIMGADIIGPVLTRIWDTPESGFAERLKHVIEPTVAIDYTTDIADFRRAPILSDASDFVVGDTMRVTYGLNNRLFSRGRAQGDVLGQTREFVTVGIQQTFYSNAEASRYDTSYVSTLSRDTATTLSPIALNMRVAPSGAIDVNTRIEYDVSSGDGLQMLTTNASLTTGQTSGSVSYSRRSLVKGEPADDYLSASTSLGFFNGAATGTYSLSWDIGRSTIVSQNVMASYMAQCCGLQLEFQNFNYPEFESSFPIPSDRRINFTFVLAGLGTFSNFFGTFGE